MKLIKLWDQSDWFYNQGGGGIDHTRCVLFTWSVTFVCNCLNIHNTWIKVFNNSVLCFFSRLLRLWKKWIFRWIICVSFFLRYYSVRFFKQYIMWHYKGLKCILHIGNSQIFFYFLRIQFDKFSFGKQKTGNQVNLFLAFFPFPLKALCNITKVLCNYFLGQSYWICQNEP